MTVWNDLVELAAQADAMPEGLMVDVLEYWSGGVTMLEGFGQIPFASNLVHLAQEVPPEGMLGKAGWFDAGLEFLAGDAALTLQEGEGGGGVSLLGGYGGDSSDDLTVTLLPNLGPLTQWRLELADGLDGLFAGRPLGALGRATAYLGQGMASASQLQALAGGWQEKDVTLGSNEAGVWLAARAFDGAMEVCAIGVGVDATGSVGVQVWQYPQVPETLSNLTSGSLKATVSQLPGRQPLALVSCEAFFTWQIYGKPEWWLLVPKFPIFSTLGPLVEGEPVEGWPGLEPNSMSTEHPTAIQGVAALELSISEVQFGEMSIVCAIGPCYGDGKLLVCKTKVEFVDGLQPKMGPLPSAHSNPKAELADVRSATVCLPELMQQRLREALSLGARGKTARGPRKVVDDAGDKTNLLLGEWSNQ